MARTVTAVFDDAASASDAVDRLLEQGISRDAISVLMSEETRGRGFEVQTRTKAPEGIATAGTVGGGLGALAGGLLAIGALSVSGVGLVAAGPLVAALVGAGAGAAAGGLIGGLIGLGIPEHEAQMAAEKIEKGGILIGIDAADSDQADVVEDILENSHGYAVATY